MNRRRLRNFEPLLPDSYDFGRRRGFGIHIRDGAGESAQGALGGSVFDAPLLHLFAHQVHYVLMHNHRTVGNECPHADRVVNRHEGLDARTEVCVILLPEIVRVETGAFIDQVANDVNVAKIGGRYEGSDSFDFVLSVFLSAIRPGEANSALLLAFSERLTFWSNMKSRLF